MEWKQFKESEKEYPEAVVETVISGFNEATGGLVDLSVSNRSDYYTLNTKLKTRFQFNLNLFSKNLKDYSFRICQFGYNIELYPVTVIIEQSILNDVNKKQNEGWTNIIGVPDEGVLKKVLESIFQSERFHEVVSGLMKIAKKNDDPF